MKLKLSSIILTSLALTLPFSSQAHRAWIVPTATVLPAENAWVTFDAAVSNDIFHADHSAYRLNSVSIQGPDGSDIKMQNESTGKYRSTFDLELTQQGTYKIFSASSGLRARWVDDEGKRQGWPKRGQDAKPEDFASAVPKNAKELSVSQGSRRIETFVTAGTPTTEVFKSTNQGLELIPVTHPNDLYAGETATFKMLIDGEAAADAKVLVLAGGMRYRNSQDEIEATTDEQGRFSITWPQAGMYWLSASYKDDKATAPATQRQGGYAASFEVLPQ